MKVSITPKPDHGPVNDTSAKPQEVYNRRIAEMTPAERINISVELWRAGHALQLAGMRRLYPDADDAEIIFRIAESRFGTELANKAYCRR